MSPGTVGLAAFYKVTFIGTPLSFLCGNVGVRCKENTSSSSYPNLYDIITLVP